MAQISQEDFLRLSPEDRQQYLDLAAQAGENVDHLISPKEGSSYAEFLVQQGASPEDVASHIRELKKKNPQYLENEETRASNILAAQKESDSAALKVIKPALDYTGRALDYVDGLTRTAAYGGAGEFMEQNPVALADVGNALKGKAPSSSEFLDRMGVDHSTSLGLASDLALSPSLLLTGGASVANKLGRAQQIAKLAKAIDEANVVTRNAAKLRSLVNKGVQNLGEFSYASGIKRIEERAKEMGKEPLTPLLLEEGVSGSNAQIQKRMDDLGDNYKTKVDAILEQSKANRGEVSMADSMSAAQAEIASIRASGDPALQPIADTYEAEIQKYLALDPNYENLKPTFDPTEKGAVTPIKISDETTGALPHKREIIRQDVAMNGDATPIQRQYEFQPIKFVDNKPDNSLAEIIRRAIGKTDEPITTPRLGEKPVVLYRQADHAPEMTRKMTNPITFVEKSDIPSGVNRPYQMLPEGNIASAFVPNEPAIGYVPEPLKIAQTDGPMLKEKWVSAGPPQTIRNIVQVDAPGTIKEGPQAVWLNMPRVSRGEMSVWPSGPDAVQSTGYKSSLYGTIGPSEWRTDKVRKAATSGLDKSMALGLRDQIEKTVGKSVSPEAEQALHGLNEKLGRILTTKEIAAHMAKLEGRKGIMPTQTKLGIGAVSPEAMLGMYLGQILNTAGFATHSGRALYNLGKEGAAYPLLKRGYIDTTKEEAPTPWLAVPTK